MNGDPNQQLPPDSPRLNDNQSVQSAPTPPPATDAPAVNTNQAATETEGFYRPEPTPQQQLDDMRNFGQSAAPAGTLSGANTIGGQHMAWSSAGSPADQKSKTWYTAVIFGSIGISVLVYLLSKDVVSAGAVALAGPLFGALGIRRQQTVHYAIDSTGISVGQKRFDFAQFRTFTIVEENGYASITLMPLKRFGIPLSLSYAPEMQEQVVGALAEHLPFEAHKRDALDQLTSRIKF